MKKYILSIIIFSLVLLPISTTQAIDLPSIPGVPGLGDLGGLGGDENVPITTKIDEPHTKTEEIKNALVSAFQKEAQKKLDEYVKKIEDNYKITNFLIYTDALVEQQYLDTYLTKYVKDPEDRKIIRQLVPEVSCGQKPDLAGVFKSKASSYLGYEPEALSVDDPNFNQKLAKMGDFLSSPIGWSIYYDDIAAEAEVKAQTAAENEINSPGFKAGRSESGDDSINRPINSVVSQQLSALQSRLDITNNKAEFSLGAEIGQLSSLLGSKAGSLLGGAIGGVVGKGVASDIAGVAQRAVTGSIASVILGALDGFTFNGLKVYEGKKTCFEAPKVRLFNSVSSSTSNSNSTDPRVRR